MKFFFCSRNFHKKKQNNFQNFIYRPYIAFIIEFLPQNWQKFVHSFTKNFRFRLEWQEKKKLFSNCEQSHPWEKTTWKTICIQNGWKLEWDRHTTKHFRWEIDSISRWASVCVYVVVCLFVWASVCVAVATEWVCCRFMLLLRSVCVCTRARIWAYDSIWLWACIKNGHF